MWGEDVILSAERLRYNIAARAMNYLEVFVIGRTELFEIASNFPVSHKHIRMCAAKLALRRDVIFRARAERARHPSETLVGSNFKTFDRLLAMASSSPSTTLQSKLQQQVLGSGARFRPSHSRRSTVRRSTAGLRPGARRGSEAFEVVNHQLEEQASRTASQAEEMRMLRSQVELLTATLQTIHPSDQWRAPEGQAPTPPAAAGPNGPKTAGSNPFFFDPMAA